MTAAEIAGNPSEGFPCAFMACQFSPYTEGLTNIPDSLPAGSILILNDRMPCQGHSPDLTASQLQEAVDRLGCESVLLDFQRPHTPEAEAIVRTVIHSLTCPVGVTEYFAQNFDCPVFLSPAPLHISLADRLTPWQGREVWLEAALCQEEIRITGNGTSVTAQFPPFGLTGGFYEEALCCHYHSEIAPEQVIFTLFDTPESLEKKLDAAASLGVTRAVGLWQELGTFLPGTESA